MTTLFVAFNFSLSESCANDKIGVLYSYKNVQSYEKNNIANFEQQWKSFLDTFEQSYLNYQFLTNIDSETQVNELGSNVIFFPLACDISKDEENLLDKFIYSGGKLIISTGDGPFSENLKNFLMKHKILLAESKIIKSSLTAGPIAKQLIIELQEGKFYTRFEPLGFGRKVFAKWRENYQVAIGGTRNITYIGYNWGQDIDEEVDINVLMLVLEGFDKGLSEELTKELSESEYKKLTKEINFLKEEAFSVIEVSEELDFSAPKIQLKKFYQDGVDSFKDFNTNYLFGNYRLAREDADLSRHKFSIVYSSGIPARKVEVRAIWLDRGTIVNMKDPHHLKNLIKNLARTGFNVIFFETLNAGYPIYPSKLLPQNPLIKGWDPLKVAVEAAHANGIELHAWVWTFAVGNIRHNVLIGKQENYLGPVISTKGRRWVLAGVDGELRIDGQPEIWISPANKKACDFIKELFKEIVANYEIDGIQFDYIRFPFQKADSQAGFDFITKMSFKKLTGKLLDLKGKNSKAFIDWKTNQVSKFVKDTGSFLKQIKPELKISCAVFAIDRYLRINLIQQDWESWIINGWIDAVYPFYYSFGKDEILEKIKFAKQLVNDGGIIIPGFNLRTLNVGDLAERINLARNSGVLGVALFAAWHLDGSKEDLLRKGPFRETATYLPYANPVVACQRLLDEFSLIIEKFAVKKNILAEEQAIKEIFTLTLEIRNDFKYFSIDRANEIEKKLINLKLKLNDLLSLEKYLQREQRAMYIKSYIDQVITLLNYIKNNN